MLDGLSIDTAEDISVRGSLTRAIGSASGSTKRVIAEHWRIEFTFAAAVSLLASLGGSTAPIDWGIPVWLAASLQAGVLLIAFASLWFLISLVAYPFRAFVELARERDQLRSMVRESRFRYEARDWSAFTLNELQPLIQKRAIDYYARVEPVRDFIRTKSRDAAAYGQPELGERLSQFLQVTPASEAEFEGWIREIHDTLRGWSAGAALPEFSDPVSHDPGLRVVTFWP